MRHLGNEATIRSYLGPSDRELIPPEDDDTTTVPVDPLESSYGSSALKAHDEVTQPEFLPQANSLDSTDGNELSPTTLSMLDFWWLDGPEQIQSFDQFDLDVWLDLDRLQDHP